MDRDIYGPPMNPGAVPPPPREVFAVMGEANIERMLEDFYLELGRGSPALRALFPADMVAASRRSAAFFIGLLGGPPRYHERYGNPMMRARHLPFEINDSRRDEWLACFERVLADAPARYQFPAEHLEAFRAFLHGFSAWMVNSRDA